jgi:putative ABC transport system permease protein
MWSIWDNWYGYGFTHTYVVLRPGQLSERVQAKLPDLALRHGSKEWASVFGFQMMALTDLHLYGRQRYGLPSFHGDPSTCYALGCIGVFIVVVACINFMNLATARATPRIREIGMCKAVGARRLQLVGQFLIESVSLSVLSFCLTLGLIALVLPALNGFLVTQLSLEMSALPALLSLSVCVGLLAGLYPAIFLSSFPPTAALEGSRGSKSGHRVVRSGLVVIQFAISVVLVISTLIVIGQTEYLRSADPGFSQESLVVTRRAVSSGAPALGRRLRKVPGVIGVSLTGSSLSQESWSQIQTVGMRKEGSVSEMQLTFLHVDAAFLDVYQIPLLEGRPFNEEYIKSNERNPLWYVNVLIVNQTAADRFGIQVGDRLNYFDRSCEIVGICRNFNYTSLHEPIGPLVLDSGIFELQTYFTIRLTMANAPEVLSRIKSIWKESMPNQPFEMEFVEASRAALYAVEERLGHFFAVASGLAIFIAALGLLGLIAYTIEARTREVAVRKVLGATESSVVQLLTKEFLVLVTLSSLIACPVAYIATSHWLQNFAYRIPITAGFFVSGTIASLAITIVTITWQALKAARANPIQALGHG